MEIRQLRTFVQVARSGSFSRAALALDIAQPALSRQVRKLEDELGASLFYRTGRGVDLTPEGELLVGYARSILDLAEEATNGLRGDGGRLSGSAAIGLPPTVGRALSLPLATLFKREHPSIRLRIVEGFSGNVLEWLAAGTIDVGVLYAAPMERSIVADPVVTEELVLVGPPGSRPPHRYADERVRAADLAGLPLILPSPNHGLRRHVDQFASDLGLRLDVVLELDALFSMVESVRRELGFTILSRVSVARDVEQGAIEVWPIVEPALTRTLYVATSSRQSRGGTTHRIAGIVRQRIEGLRREGVWRDVVARPDDARAGRVS